MTPGVPAWPVPCRARSPFTTMVLEPFDGMMTVPVRGEVAKRYVPLKNASPTCVAPSQRVTRMRSVGDDEAEVLDIWRATLSRRIASLVPLKRRAPNGTFVLPAAASAYAGLEESRATVRAPLPVTVMRFPAVSVAAGVVGVIVCEEAAPVPVKVARLPASPLMPQSKLPTAPDGISHLMFTSLPVPFGTTRAVSNVNV